MNLHPPSVLGQKATVQVDRTANRIHVFIGDAMLAMTSDEAHALAAALNMAAYDAATLVPIPGIQHGNTDIHCEHATAGGDA